LLCFAGSIGYSFIALRKSCEYCGKTEQHDDQLYLALNDIEHTKTKAQSPQTNGICERFHKTILQEFYQIILLKKI
jgi:transposase InsO family protein